MFVKRNDQCPCGSGKKYKKCCLKKENIYSSQELKEERFTQKRKAMLSRIYEFLTHELSLVEYAKLVKHIKAKTSNQITATSFMHFWLSFYFRFETGIGLQCFLEKNNDRLTQTEKELVESWIHIKPSILQVVQKSENQVLFEDVITKVQYNISTTKEYSEKILPWCGAIGFIENVEGKTYFLGETIFLNPSQTEQAIDTLNELASRNHLTYHDVLKENYLEVLSKVFCSKLATDQKQREIDQYTLVYKLLDESLVEQFFKGNKEIKVEEWGPKVKHMSWVGGRKVYSDNQINGFAYIYEVLGQIKIQDSHLQFTCYDLASLEIFKQQLKRLGSILVLLYERLNNFSIPYNADFKNLIITLDEDVPPFFYEYAKQSLDLDLDRPQPYFNELTIRQLIEFGNHESVDSWLKQCEYNLYHLIQSKYDDINITPDFNSIRKELGIKLSLFVTGGKNRISSVRATDSDNTSKLQNMLKDKIFYDDLGLTEDHLDLFFTEDLIEFYKEKTAGKSENTIRKYRLSLLDLKDLLTNQTYASWKSFNSETWKAIITNDYYQIYGTTTKTQVKDFHSTVKALSKWLDQKYELSFSQDVVQIVKEQEDGILV